MIGHYLSTALRNFCRHKLTTTINIVGLALGLACFIGAYGTVVSLNSGDRYSPRADRMYVIETRNLWFVSSSPVPIAKHLRAFLPTLEVGRLEPRGQSTVSIGERVATVQIASAEPEVLDILDFRRVQFSNGKPLANPGTVVLTTDAAQRLFGTTQVLGRTLRLDRLIDVVIGGVIEKPHQPSHIGTAPGTSFDIELLVPPATLFALQTAAANGTPPNEVPETEQWRRASGMTYVLLPADGSVTVAQLNDALSRMPAPKVGEAAFQLAFRAIPVSHLRLSELDSHLFHDRALSLSPLLLGIGIAVLLIACVNHTNLTAAQVLARSHEVGLRRVLGASRSQILASHLLEACCQVVVALSLALVLLALAQPLVETATEIDIISPLLTNARFWIGAVVAALIAGLCIGAYPALAIAGRLPARMLQSQPRGRSVAPAGNAMVGLQFAVASALGIGLIVVLAQNAELRANGLKPEEDQVLVLDVPPTLARATLRHELLRDPSIKAVSGFSDLPWADSGGISSYSRRPGGSAVSAVTPAVDEDFERALGLTVLAGRAFDRARDEREPSDRTRPQPAILDEQLATELGWLNPSDAVGQLLYGDSVTEVIGVVRHRSFRIRTLGEGRANLYRLYPAGSGNVIVRLDRRAVGAALAHVDATFRTLAPDQEIRRRFMDEFFERAYGEYRRISVIVTALTTLALTIAVMGIFGMSLFLARRRTHEIGIRKTLGANSARIVAMLLAQFVRPVIIANVIAWPVAGLFAGRYLQTFVDPISLTLTPFVLSLLATLVVAAIAVGSHAVKAAHVRPAEVLRHE
jgi:putative ABC transport system permease protein